MTIEEKLSIVLDVLVEYPQKYEKLKQDLQIISSERQDILHALELGKLDAIQRTKLVNDLKVVQNRRRKAYQCFHTVKRWPNLFDEF